MNTADLMPVIIPLAILEIALTLFSLIHVLTHTKYKCGNRVIWIIVSFFSIIGPVLYFTIGRGEKE